MFILADEVAAAKQLILTRCQECLPLISDASPRPHDREGEDEAKSQSMSLTLRGRGERFCIHPRLTPAQGRGSLYIESKRSGCGVAYRKPMWESCQKYCPLLGTSKSMAPLCRTLKRSPRVPTLEAQSLIKPNASNVTPGGNYQNKSCSLIPCHHSFSAKAIQV